MARVRWIAAGVAALALAAAGAWLITGDGALLRKSSSWAAVQDPGVRQLPGSSGVPSVGAAKVTALIEDPLQDESAEESSETVAQADGARPGVPVSLHGSVVDSAGHPIEGATAWYFPHRRTLRAWGLLPADGYPVPSSLRETAFPVESLPHVMTDAGGAFMLRSTAIPQGRESLGSITMSDTESCPAIIVTMEGFATQACLCPGFMAGDYDAGAIELAPGASLIGRVVDAGQHPMAGVLITSPGALRGPVDSDGPAWAALQDAKCFMQAVTDDAGAFAAHGFASGEPSLTFSARGFVKRTVKSRTVAGAIVDLGDLVLEAYSLLEGTVVDQDGLPVTGAWVKGDVNTFNIVIDDPAFLGLASGHSSEWWSRTDAAGHFAVPRPGSGPVAVMVDAAGFEPAHTNPISPDDPPLVVRLEGAALIALEVRDDVSGTPVPGAGVLAFRPSTRGADRGDSRVLPVLVGADARAALGDDSNAEFVVQRAGRIETILEVTAPGYSRRVVSVPGLLAPNRCEFTVRLPRETIVSGRVLDDHKEPVHGAVVMAMEPGDAARKRVIQAKSDDSGHYELHGLWGGTSFVFAKAQGFCESDPISLDLQSGVAPSSLDIELIRPGSIEGSLRDAGGSPLPGCALSLFGTEESPDVPWVDDVQTDVSGDFHFGDVPPREWTLNVQAPGAEPLLVAVAPGAVTRMEIVLAPEATLGGRVLTASGAPIAGAVVTLLPLPKGAEAKDDVSISERKATSHANGEWKQSLPAGEYQVYAVAGVSASTVHTITITKGQTLRLDLFMSSLGIAGLALDAETSAPVAGLRVHLGLPGAHHWLYGQTGDDGRFDLSVPPGSYSGYVVGGQYCQTGFGPFSVAAGSSPSELVVKLPRGAAVHGSIHQPDGKRVPDGTSVDIIGVADDGTIHYFPGALTRNAEYRLEGLPGGTYRIRAGSFDRSWDLSGAPGGAVELTLSTGEERVLDLIYVGQF